MRDRCGRGLRRAPRTAIAAAIALAISPFGVFAQDHAHGVDHSQHADQARSVDHSQRADQAQSVGDSPHAGQTHGADHAAGGGDAGYVVPPITAEQRAAAFPDLGDVRGGHGTHEDPFNSFVLIDRLEAAEAHGAERLDWDVEAWVGRSLRRVWLRSKGEHLGGATAHADVELFAGIAIARWWEIVAGARHDFEPNPSRTWAALGVQGLAPYGFELEATAYLGEGGRSAARVDAAQEFAITPRLIVEPSLELDWYGSSDRERGLGRGLSSGELALRLRYEVRREVAPYVGVVREKAFGETADLRRAAGRDPDDTRVVAGIRLWF